LAAAGTVAFLAIQQQPKRAAAGQVANQKRNQQPRHFQPQTKL
jgi:hypothetical protein